jgi:hypothetical protein
MIGYVPAETKTASDHCQGQRLAKHTVQCYGHLTTSEHQLYSVSPLKTPFGLLIPLLQSSPTRNNNHSQLFITLCHIYIAYNLTCLHWLTSQLSITISNYHTLYILTLPVSVSYRDFTRRTTVLNNCYLTTDCFDIPVPLI